MCLDPQILSLYIDGELPSPWKEKLEAHVGSCLECQKRLEVYKSIRSTLASNGIEAAERTKDRVWARVTALEGESQAGSSLHLIRKSDLRAAGNHTVWGRTISLPLPAATAAAAAIIAAFLFIVTLRQPGQSPVQESMASAVGTDVQGMMPVSDLDGVLQYLSSQDTSDYMIIRLPESRNFSSSGDPALLKAADYTGRSVTSQ